MIIQLTGTNRSGSPEVSLSGGNSSTFAWGPFGGGTARTGSMTSLPGFNGERQDPLSEVTHLGNGYRAYSPSLRRFTCPDSASPFGIGGINPYVYCDHDPVNRTDPNGHGPITWLIRKVITLSVKLGIASEEAADSIAAGLATASAVENGTEIATQVATGIGQQIAKARGNLTASRELTWASLSMGLAGGDIRHTVKKLRKSAKRYGLKKATSSDSELSSLFGPEGGYRRILDETLEKSAASGAMEMETLTPDTPLRSRMSSLHSLADDNLVNNAEFSLSDRNGTVMQRRAGGTTHIPGSIQRGGSVIGDTAVTPLLEPISQTHDRLAGTRLTRASVFDPGEMSARVRVSGRHVTGKELLLKTLILRVRRQSTEPGFRSGAVHYTSFF